MVNWYDRVENLLPLQRRSEHPWTEGAAIALGHFVLCYLGFVWMDKLSGVSPMWPASGIALLAVLRLGWRAYPILLVSKILATMTAGYPLLFSFWTNLGDPLKAIVAIWAWKRMGVYALPRKPMTTLMLHFLATCAVLGLSGASIGAVGLWAAGAPLSWHAWFAWILGDAIGAAVMTPLLLRWTLVNKKGPLDWKWLRRLLLWNALVAAITVLLFRDTETALSLGFLILPLLLWAAFRLRFEGIIVLNATFVLSTLCCMGAATAAHLNFVSALLGVGIISGMVASSFSEELVLRDMIGQSTRERLARANRNLREQERRLSTLIDHLPDAIIILDQTSVLHTNKAAERLHKTLFPSAPDASGWHRLAGGTLVYSGISTNGESALVSVRSDAGQQYSLEMRISSVDWMNETRRLCVLRDITDQKRADDELRESETRFGRVFQLSPDSISIVSLDEGRVIEINLAFETIFGYTRDEVLGETVYGLGIWEKASDREAVMREVAAKGEVRCKEARMRRKDGRQITVELSAKEVRWKGESYLVTILDDISERVEYDAEKRKLEAQLRQAQKLEAIGTLAGGIAHDFNNVLTAVLGNAQLSILETDEKSPARPLLKNIIDAGMRARDLVAQIMTFSRRQEQKRSISSLQPVVEETIGLLRATLPANIRLETEYLERETKVLCDQSQIHQVILNLCTNALHAMRPNGGLLKISVGAVDVDGDLLKSHPKLSEGRYAKLTVKDTGCGMTEEVLGRIFEPFFTTKPQGEGTGLGLAVVHGIVESHQGTMTVYSREGEGTVFNLFFPIVDERGEHETGRTPHGELARGKGESLIVIDDEAVIVDTLEKMLRRLGYTPVCFTNPDLAMRAYASEPWRYKAILSDLSMPGRSGIQVARELGPRQGLRFILMSGYLTENDAAEARAAGVHHTVEKPLDLSNLAEVLARALGANRS